MSPKPIRTREYLYQEYITNQKSVGNIAEENGTYPNKIRRELLYYGIPLRDRSDAQSVALTSGRHSHPTKGKQREDSVKSKIGKNVSASWKTISKEERERRSQASKTQWANMSEDEREEFKRRGIEAVRQSSKVGSKIERFLYDKFISLSIPVEFHKKDFIPYTKLVPDLYLSTYNTVVEVDGPTHYENIWGEDYLAKKMGEDAEKNGTLIAAGYNVIRLRVMRKNLSKVFKDEVFDKLMETLEQIALSPSANSNMEDRLIYLEVD